MDGKSLTAVTIMLAGGAAVVLCLRQHLRAPDSHTTEVTAAGTALHHLYPIRGLLHEMGVHMTYSVPVYCDSQSTIFVAHDSGAIKRSIWLLRRAAVLREAVDNGIIHFVKIADRDNCSDMETKPIPHEKLLHLLQHTHPHWFPTGAPKGG